jgi:alginate O-acetyltransferase complex protein AlgI
MAAALDRTFGLLRRSAMTFVSPEFLFFFLPITVFGFFAIRRFGPTMVAVWLTLASLFFYGWWSTQYLWLLGGSIVFNYVVGDLIGWAARCHGNKASRLVLAAGVAGDLGLLAYFKYANFFADVVGTAVGVRLTLGEIILPLGISFFTFTQIAYLVDRYRGQAEKTSPWYYALFVTYFPHLIAGPILHHRQMIPQFADANTYRLSAENIAVGFTIFSIGMFKKLMLADEVAPYANQVFDAAARGAPLTFLEAWTGALAYCLQIYFDFSGYSDMAIGLSRLFGIQLPINFNSPYKALNIIEFWRRWHMTLSAFLRDYLYIPLGGNRKGPARRYINVLVTMLLGGLWHGAGWTFVIWGGLHGIYLVINHGWRHVAGHLPIAWEGRAWRTFSWALTFLAVVVAWVYFRAPTLSSANAMLLSMADVSSIGRGVGQAVSFDGVRAAATLGVLLAIALALPNTQQFMGRFRPGWEFREGLPGGMVWLQWRPNWLAAVTLGCVTVWMLANIVFIKRVSDFIYFQF